MRGQTAYFTCRQPVSGHKGQPLLTTQRRPVTAPRIALEGSTGAFGHLEKQVNAVRCDRQRGSGGGKSACRAVCCANLLCEACAASTAALQAREHKMIALQPPLRLAVEADAPQLADLVNFAGEGLPLHVWTDLAREGQNPWEIGRARQAEKARGGKVVVVDRGNGAIASLTGYVVGPEPEAIGDDVPLLFLPLLELENQALDSWYVNVLACYPDYRGQGIGSHLLDVAEKICLADGLRRMSVIVAGNNPGARRLYERHGYEEVASRPCIREGWDTDTDRWVLMMKHI